jgi:phosphohistidine phosphatase
MTARTLVLLRHAKAERPTGHSDVERPLTERGHADAGAAGAWLAAHGYVPDLVLCSTAKRTRQTWHGVALALPSAPAVRYEKKLYAGGAREMLSVVAAAKDDARTVLVIGHNPAVSELSALLDPDGRAADSDGLRTCGLAVHDVATPWEQCASGRAPLSTAYTARA